MFVAQWTPPSGVDSGPVETGPAYTLLTIGAVVACLGALLLAAKERRGGGYLVGLGVTMAALGALVLLLRYNQDRSEKDALHNAAESIARSAVESGRHCATEPPPSPFVYPSGLLPGGETSFTPPPCSLSPRGQVTTYLLTSVGRFRAVEAASFATTGGVTVTDPRNGAQVCATVPDDPQGTWTVSDGPCP
ncbi:hypothetical protein [Yinghuangia seranimata]|uniref:hypothetical protein n=1 Tax=Yinghuangia seranimata TaxID=408067 RepID=UPI00248C3AFA|nr:hypothetical protein [Yinghuangia seranimata]MDI2125650.1 hypothetical protein [Yinghuangia seranimata]